MKSLFKLAFILFGLFYSLISFCQENYQPGYIIKSNGDTLRGYIDNRDWEYNPNIIYFKDSIISSRTRYTPSTIHGFSVNGENYESAFIKTEIKENNLYEIDFYKESKIINDSTFLRTIVKGDKGLYFYKNKDGWDKFYIKQANSYDLLVYDMYFKNSNGYNNLIENKKYIGQLLVYLDGCPSLKTKINRTAYNKKDIEKLFISYYNCTQTNISFHKETERLAIEFGLLAGVSISSIKFSGNENDKLVIADYDKSINFTGGVFFDVIRPRNQGKLSLCNELLFTSFNIKGSYNDYYSTGDITLKYSYIKMNNLLRFKYPINNSFLYANAGVSSGYAILESSSIKEFSKFHDTNDKESIGKTKSIELGLIFGLGAKFKQYSFEVRYERGNGITENTVDLLSNTNKIHFLLGYKFK